MSNNSSSDLIFIILGPSGAGKSSFVDRSIEEISQLRDTVTYTTRKMRSGESEGFPYHFVTKNVFEKKVSENFFIEWAQVHGNLYGTPQEQISQGWSDGKALIMDIDIQGARSFIAKYPQCITIFIYPPSLEALRERILQRDGANINPEDLQIRMNNAKIEMQLADEFNHQIVNDSFEVSYAKFKKIIEHSLKK